MKIYNCTGQHLTGADRRFLRRLYNRKFRTQRAWMASYYGDEEGAAMAKKIRQSQERTLTQDDGMFFTANAVWKHPGRDKPLVAEGTTWSKTYNFGPVAWAPVIRV